MPVPTRMSFWGCRLRATPSTDIPQNDVERVVPFYVPIPVPVPAPIDSQSTQITRELYRPAYTPSIIYNDFSASYKFTPNIELAGGLTNAFDRAPPRIPGAEAGGANFELDYQAGVYDVIGRTFFATR